MILREGRVRAVSLLAATVVLSLGLSACGGGGDNEGSSQTGGGSLTVRGMNNDWVSFDFQANNVNHNLAAVAPAYDRLLAYGPDFELIGGLAGSWEVTPADRPTTVTFKLRQDAKCEDGTAVTPSVVAASFTRLFSVKKTTDLTKGTFGAGPFDFKADDATWTFTFNTKTPFRDLEAGFAWGGSAIVCPAGLKALETDPKALETKMYGSGPFTLSSATHASEIVFKRKDAWTWGPDNTTYKTLPETLTYKYVPKDTTAANLLLTGGMDIGWAAGTDGARLKADTSFVSKQLTNWGVWNLVFNMTPGRPTTDEALREAIGLAFDSQEYIQVVYQGQGIKTNSYLAPGMPCYDPETETIVPATSIPEAQSVLAAAGYTLSDGKLMKDGKQVTLKATGFNFAAPAGGDYVVSQLTKLGIKVDLDPPSGYATSTVSGNFDLGIISSTSVAPLSTKSLSIYSGAAPPDGTNFGNTAAGDQELAGLISQAYEYAGDRGCEILGQIQRLYLEKHYLRGVVAAQMQMVGKGWDFLPSQVYEVYAFKRK